MNVSRYCPRRGRNELTPRSGRIAHYGATGCRGPYLTRPRGYFSLRPPASVLILKLPTLSPNAPGVESDLVLRAPRKKRRGLFVVARAPLPAGAGGSARRNAAA